MKVLLLAGGDSSERSVSLNSGKAVYDTLQRLGHKVYAIDPSTGRSLLTSDGAFVELKAEATSKSLPTPVSKTWSLATALGSPGFTDIDVVFITLHGGSGENGKIQCLLDLAGKKYTGSNMAASAIAMDKAVAKRLCVSEDIRTPDWALYRIRGKKIDDRLLHEISHRFEFPIIVKPNDGGSTIGLSKVDSEKELPEALEKGVAESSDILVEEYILGREITAAVLDGRSLPLVEIRPENELYDFEAKYTKGKSDYIVPAEIDDAVARSIQQAAVKICSIVGATGLVRVDFILDAKNEFYFLELNTLPGMTELSLAPMAASAVGIGFDQLIAKLIESALHR
ncbi:MAG: D-alanine--D-alanine ligase [Candidatus Zixiibacteriota bacterium]|nr:MAG: D-alanine--D-alanine ligase [candidate division Zixibacteria bacterium]